MPTKWQREVEQLLSAPSSGTAGTIEALKPRARNEDYAVGVSSGQGVWLLDSNAILSMLSVDYSTAALDRIATLEARVTALQKEVHALQKALEGDREVVVLRTISREQAKQEIRELFASGETLYYSDIVQRLGLDIALVIDLCKELEAEGEVVTLGNAA